MSSIGFFHRRPWVPRKRPATVRLSVELLEDRCLLSVTNVLVNNNLSSGSAAQNTQSETSIVLANNGEVVVAFNDSGSYGSGSNHFTGFAYSTTTVDGVGMTDQGKLPSSTYGDAGDPSLAVNTTTGAVYLATLGLNAGNRLQLFKSTDNGHTFGAPVNSAPGFGAAHTLDKEWITVDNFADAGNGNIYQVFTDFQGNRDNGIFFNKSTDGGATWSKAISLGGHQGGNVVVGKNHEVYVFFWNASAPEKIMVRKSTNQGVSFGAAITVATLATSGSNGDLGLGFRTNAFPQAGVNAVTGDLYVVYNDKSGGDRANVYFKQSSNGGINWSAAVKLNDDGTTRDQWQPSIAVTPDGTHVLVSWYDRRLDPANSLIDRFGVIGTVSGSTITWGANGRITDTSFAAVYGNDPVVNRTYMGDYDAATADNSYFYTTWGDNRLGNPDVRFSKIAIDGTGFVVGAAASSSTGGGSAGTGGSSPHSPQLNAAAYPPGYLGGVYLVRFNEADWIAIGETDHHDKATWPLADNLSSNAPTDTDPPA